MSNSAIQIFGDYFRTGLCASIVRIRGEEAILHVGKRVRNEILRSTELFVQTPCALDVMPQLLEVGILLLEIGLVHQPQKRMVPLQMLTVTDRRLSLEAV